MSHKFSIVIAGALALLAPPLKGFAFPSAWRYEQHFTVASPGLVRLSLPPGTLNGARPNLEDLRLYDDAGRELPYAIERPVPVIRPLESPRSFRVSLEPASTVITIETGLAQPIDNISLETPATDFLKGVTVEGSSDGRNWQLLVEHQPIFRTSSGAALLRVSFPSGLWAWLRLRVDDQRSAPIPFLRARFQATAVEPAPVESQLATLLGRDENPGETRLTVDLGAANLDLASIGIETDEPLFTRVLTLVQPQITDATIREQPVGQGVIYRVTIDGQPSSANLSVPLLATRVTSREVTLLIRNEDSPPLRVSAVRFERRPVYLTFLAPQSGAFHLLTGNRFCPSPRYDLAQLGARFKDVPMTAAVISPPADNPDYRPPETLPGLEISGAPLEVADWAFRKPIHLDRNGAQQVEFDLDVVAHAAADFSDVRIAAGTNQMPYIIEHTSISRVLPLTVSASNDVKHPGLSRWAIHLPRPGVPFVRLACDSRTALFQRQMAFYEEVPGERGELNRVVLGEAAWTQTPERPGRHFSLSFATTPQTTTLFLQTENGDNPPIELENFTASYPATRALFKANAGNELFLYYGNARATTPRYDLSLVAGDLLMADKSPATLLPEQQLKQIAKPRAPATGGVLFWLALAAVVVGLLAIIARLLPKAAA